MSDNARRLENRTAAFEPIGAFHCFFELNTGEEVQLTPPPPVNVCRPRPDGTPCLAGGRDSPLQRQRNPPAENRRNKYKGLPSNGRRADTAKTPASGAGKPEHGCKSSTEPAQAAARYTMSTPPRRKTGPQTPGRLRRHPGENLQRRLPAAHTSRTTRTPAGQTRELDQRNAARAGQKHNQHQRIMTIDCPDEAAPSTAAGCCTPPAPRSEPPPTKRPKPQAAAFR